MASPIKGLHDSIEGLKGEKKPHNKLKILKESHASGVITDEEFEKEKAPLEKEIEDFDKKEVQESPKDDEPKKSDKSLIYGVLFILVLFAAVFAYIKLAKEDPKTIEELHVLNLKGELDPKQGYVYNGAYSFVTLDNQWYTQLVSSKGTKEYNLALRYSPRDLENISIKGVLDADFFNNQSQYYVTFNPTAKDLQYVVLAVADLNTHMTKVFEKTPIAACDRNETAPCASRPIVDCDDKDKVVFYVRNSTNLNVLYGGNCIIVEGSGFDVVRGMDRVLYDLYDIME